MPYTGLIYHTVFSTKERRPWISPDVLPRICEYMGGFIRNHKCHPCLINGPVDHLHLVLSFPVTVYIPDFMRDMKSWTSRWIHQTFPLLKAFAWQVSYSMFTVSPSVLPRLMTYVRNQQEHHKKVSFRDELIWLLKNHGIKYEERFLE
jgi:putative transposase